MQKTIYHCGPVHNYPSLWLNPACLHMSEQYQASTTSGFRMPKRLSPMDLWPQERQEALPSGNSNAYLISCSKTDFSQEFHSLQ